MHCSRCYSLMAKDHLLVFEGATGRMWTDGYRCMNCGHVHESPIQQYHLITTKAYVRKPALRTRLPGRRCPSGS